MAVWDTDHPEINVETPHHAGMWESQGEGNTQVLNVKELQFNLNPQMDEHRRSALAVLEISHVTRRMTGDSPSVLSHHRD